MIHKYVKLCEKVEKFSKILEISIIIYKERKHNFMYKFLNCRLCTEQLSLCDVVLWIEISSANEIILYTSSKLMDDVKIQNW